MSHNDHGWDVEDGPVNPEEGHNPPRSLAGYCLHELGEIPVRDDGPRGAWVVFGGQVGSEGKGAIAGYLARRHQWGAAICTFMTNTGHTWVGDDGTKVVVQQIPMAAVSPSVELLLIAGGAAITLEQLEREINELDRAGRNVSNRLRIHPRAVIIEARHREHEHEHLYHISSTAKGCGAALAAKTARSKNVLLARDVPWLKDFIADTTYLANHLINSGRGVLVEAAQGFDLDINHGIEYPYCTSRGTTPMQVLADCGIDGRMVMRSIAVLRTFPIRVGGPSGPFGADEIDWDQVSQRAGRPVEEITTVTKKVRRVFEMDYERIRHMSQICRPTDIALTGVDYIEPLLAGAHTEDVKNNGVTPVVSKMVWNIEQAVKRNTARPRVRLLKTGPADGQIIDQMGPATVDLGSAV